MKDSPSLRRLKRLATIALGNLKLVLWRSLPYIVAFYFGSMFGAGWVEGRIHYDCKFTNSFRIDTTGYICEIGK